MRISALLPHRVQFSTHQLRFGLFYFSFKVNALLGIHTHYTVYIYSSKQHVWRDGNCVRMQPSEISSRFRHKNCFKFNSWTSALSRIYVRTFVEKQIHIHIISCTGLHRTHTNPNTYIIFFSRHPATQPTVCFQEICVFVGMPITANEHNFLTSALHPSPKRIFTSLSISPMFTNLSHHIALYMCERSGVVWCGVRWIYLPIYQFIRRHAPTRVSWRKQ